MEAQRELRKLIRNNEGRYFLVRIVTPGMHHGRDDCLLYGEDGFANSNDDVLVEFYDFTYATAVKTDSAFGERGQFVGSYYRKTLLGEDGFGHGDLDVYGLDLDGGVPVWKVDAKAMSEVYQWLRSEPVAGEIAEAISEANSEAKSGPEIPAEMPTVEEEIEDREQAEWEANFVHPEVPTLGEAIERVGGNLISVAPRESDDKTIVLVQLPGTVQPYVTWLYGEQRGDLFWGHYFDNVKDAWIDFDKRTKDA